MITTWGSGDGHVTSYRVLRDTIQPFPTFSEIYVAALKALHGQITATLHPNGR